MKIKIAKEKREIEYFTTKVICDFCKTEFDKLTVECGGYGKVNVSFGYGSKYDGAPYKFHICDACFEKYFKNFITKNQIEYRNCPFCFSESGNITESIEKGKKQFRCSKCNSIWY